jgi:hypothetical protein
MCGCRARAAAAAARAAPAPMALRSIPRAPIRSRAAVPIPATMSVSVLTRKTVEAPVVAPPVVAPPPRGRFQPRRFEFRQPRPRSVVVRPPPPETLVIYDTKVWGPLLWRAIHIAAERTAERSVTLAALWEDFVFELQMSLPCPDCMSHYRAWVAAHPWRTDAVREWWADLHNAVNERKGLAAWSLEDVSAANTDLQAGRDAVAALATMLGPRAHRVLVALYERLN